MMNDGKLGLSLVSDHCTRTSSAAGGGAEEETLTSARVSAEAVAVVLR